MDQLRILRHGAHVARDVAWYEIAGPQGVKRVEVTGLEYLQDAHARSEAEIALSKYKEPVDGNQATA